MPVSPLASPTSLADRSVTLPPSSPSPSRQRYLTLNRRHYSDLGARIAVESDFNSDSDVTNSDSEAQSGDNNDENGNVSETYFIISFLFELPRVYSIPGVHASGRFHLVLTLSKLHLTSIYHNWIEIARSEWVRKQWRSRVLKEIKCL